MTAFSEPTFDLLQKPGLAEVLRARVARMVAHLVGARAERKDEERLLDEIRRLEELSPHLLADVGVREIAPGLYVTGSAAE